jgi:glycerol-1-phosphate dehydrogenase [NAD(P)+]
MQDAELQALHEAIDPWCGFDQTDADGRRYRTTTRLCRIIPQASRHAADLLLPVLGGPNLVAFISDDPTHAVAGAEALASLRQAGVTVDHLRMTPDPGRTTVRCDDATIDRVEAWLATQPFQAAVVVGAGTLNDLVKMAAHRRGIPYACIATAPSMNGYTSAIAAILSAGVKTTQPCTPPVAVLACPEVMAQAPYRMIASGIGDLYSKPVSNADWRLSHRLNDSPHSEIVMRIVEAGSVLLEGVAPRLPARDLEAVARLTAALMLSGLAMQAAGSSATASGGEHLVSHYIDMTAVAFDLPYDFHGCQVACGTLATSALYEHVRSLDPATIDWQGCLDRHPTWDDYAQTLARRFGPLTDAVLPHARAAYPSRDELARRLERLRTQWDSLWEDCGHTLRPTAELRAELESAQCPTRFPELGVDRDRALAACVWSKDIRARYTILHLAAELGVLEDFFTPWIDAQYTPA